MATHHALPSEIVDMESWGQEQPQKHSNRIVRTREMELARLVFSAGEEFKTHEVSGPIIVHCIKGDIAFTAMGTTQTLKPGQLLYLMADEPHSIQAITDAVVLLTIVFRV
ncbi:MAG: cupin domain-containing protein [Nitrosomonadales bacterium]|nr:cupin domain-containing protein [Nitrosomonadales bacterium]